MIRDAVALAARALDASLSTERFDPQCLRLISASEAWSNLVLPLHMDRGELVCATTREALPHAAELVKRRFRGRFRFVLADLHPLEQFIAERYDYEGIEIAA